MGTLPPGLAHGILGNVAKHYGKWGLGISLGWDWDIVGGELGIRLGWDWDIVGGGLGISLGWDWDIVGGGLRLSSGSGWTLRVVLNLLQPIGGHSGDLL